MIKALLIFGEKNIYSFKSMKYHYSDPRLEKKCNLTTIKTSKTYLQLDNFCIIFRALQTICISDLGDTDRIFP